MNKAASKLKSKLKANSNNPSNHIPRRKPVLRNKPRLKMKYFSKMPPLMKTRMLRYHLNNMNSLNKPTRANNSK